MTVPVLTLKSLDNIKLTLNNVILKNVSDSIGDMSKKSDLIIIRNEMNNNRERALGQVVKTSDILYNGETRHSRIETKPSQVLNQLVIYDKHGRLYQIKIEDSEDVYYLVRFPDIIALCEE